MANVMLEILDGFSSNVYWHSKYMFFQVALNFELE